MAYERDLAMCRDYCPVVEFVS